MLLARLVAAQPGRCGRFDLPAARLRCYGGVCAGCINKANVVKNKRSGRLHGGAKSSTGGQSAHARNNSQEVRRWVLLSADPLRYIRAGHNSRVAPRSPAFVSHPEEETTDLPRSSPASAAAPPPEVTLKASPRLALHADGQRDPTPAAKGAAKPATRARRGAKKDAPAPAAAKSPRGRSKKKIAEPVLAAEVVAAPEEKARVIDPAQAARSGVLPYIPAIDGLRALAVAAVLLYHSGLGWLPGGFLGVEVFFVISGYLITSLLIADHRSNGHVSLGGFWRRRARRLLPAVFTLIIATLVYSVIFLPGEVAGAAGQRAGRLPLREQLVPDLPLAVLLREPGAAVAAQASLVARRGGAVLPGLAGRVLARAGPHQAALRLRADPRRRPGLQRDHGLQLRPGGRPVAHLLRHRHARQRTADRRGAGVRLAGRAPSGQGEPAVQADGGRLGRRGSDRPRLLRGDDQRAGCAALPRRLRDRRDRHDAAHRGRGPPGRQLLAPRPRPAAAALARHAIVQRLPVALAGVHADPAGLRNLDERVAGVRDSAGDHGRPRGGVVPPDRDAGAPRGDRPPPPVSAAIAAEAAAARHGSRGSIARWPRQDSPASASSSWASPWPPRVRPRRRPTWRSAKCTPWPGRSPTEPPHPPRR